MTQALEEYIKGTCKKQTYDCYTDGSCNNLSPNREGGAAYIVLMNGEEVTRRSKALFRTTNNRAEMLAIISAVNYCPSGAEIKIHTDSQYAIYAFLPRKRVTSETKNADLIHLYRKVAAQKNVSFEWVRGHNGNKYNEIADQMANGEYKKMKEQIKTEAENDRNSKEGEEATEHGGDV